MKYRVVITDQAFSRIDEQARYIAVDAQSPLNAARWLARVMDAADTLETMPRRCPRASEDGHHSFEVRALNIDGFLLLYSVNDDDRTVVVLNARHARQQPRPDEIAPTEGTGTGR